MTWKTEGTTSVRETEESRLEWLLRNFRKLSQWSGTRVAAGYGGIIISSPITLSPPVTLTTTFQKLTAFDQLVTQDPIGVIQDLANDRIAVTEPGAWVFEFAAVGEITPFTTNQAQTIEVAAYNEDKGTSVIVGYHPVPRYSEVFDVGLAGMRITPSPYGLVDLGDYFSLWIRIRNAAPVITVNTVEDMEISVFRVSS